MPFLFSKNILGREVGGTFAPEFIVNLFSDFLLQSMGGRIIFLLQSNTLRASVGFGLTPVDLQTKMIRSLMRTKKLFTLYLVLSLKPTIEIIRNVAIADFKESQDFAEAIVEGLTKAYQLGFEDCKAQVAQLYPKVNLSKVSATKEAKEEPTSATTKPNAITKANAKLPLLLLSFRL
ncbi:hypothetical protein COCNU_scaffold003311G000010 [Cocos nucifera]|nr:hypothetical protein [Cocos nucifera]